MQFAVDVPNFGPWSDPHVVAGLAQDAERAGWDGFSIWDHILVFSGAQVGDPWVLLTAAAAATERIRLFSLVTPLPRRRPWVLARQAVTLDHYCNGRLVLGVGIGEPPEPEFAAFGEPTDPRTRAAMLDEALEVITGMWSGEPFSFHGDHYTIRENVFLPRPLQEPRIPIWVAGAWPNKAPFRRAARWDGAAPIATGPGGLGLASVEDVRQVADYIARHRTESGGYDIAAYGIPPDDPDELAGYLGSFEDAGATWLRFGPAPDEAADDFAAWVRNGPPS